MALKKPGEKPTKPGEYKETGPRGGKVQNPRIVTIEPGDNPLPPTTEKGISGNGLALQDRELGV